MASKQSKRPYQGWLLTLYKWPISFSRASGAAREQHRAGTARLLRAAPDARLNEIEPYATYPMPAAFIVYRKSGRTVKQFSSLFRKNKKQVEL